MRLHTTIETHKDASLLIANNDLTMKTRIVTNDENPQIEVDTPQFEVTLYKNEKLLATHLTIDPSDAIFVAARKARKNIYIQPTHTTKIQDAFTHMLTHNITCTIDHDPLTSSDFMCTLSNEDQTLNVSDSGPTIELAIQFAVSKLKASNPAKNTNHSDSVTKATKNLTPEMIAKAVRNTHETERLGQIRDPKPVEFPDNVQTGHNILENTGATTPDNKE